MQINLAEDLLRQQSALLVEHRNRGFVARGFDGKHAHGNTSSLPECAPRIRRNTMKHGATTGGSHRLEAFSDAVFAFACTLLVVSLEVPRDFAALVADLKGFVAFGFAFTILILVWMAHYRLFRHFPLDDSWSVLLNSCLLFVVLLFVYPLKFLAIIFVKSLFGIGGDQAQGALDDIELVQLFMIYGAAFAAVFG